MSVKYTTIVELFALASKELQYPRIRLMNNVTLVKAGINAKVQNSINITDGKPYGENQWYGRIIPDGSLDLSSRCSDSQMNLVQHELQSFMENPYEYAKMYGKANANCMYCGKTLTDPQSVAVGYGPVCAAHYGLPHGELEQKVANELSQVEMELPTQLPDSFKFSNIKVGNTIKNKLSGNLYIITGHYGSRLTAIKQVDITNESEWELLS